MIDGFNTKLEQNIKVLNSFYFILFFKNNDYFPIKLFFYNGYSYK